MPYIGNDLATQFQAFATQTITGDGSTGYTLDRAVANGKELLVYINNVKQEEGSGKSYTASGTTITFSEAVASTDSCYLVYMGSAQQTVTAPDASIVSGQIANANLVMPNTLDMNGNELILDADADTSITADTDDRIDFKTGGSDTFRVNSASVSVVGGSAGTASLNIPAGDILSDVSSGRFEIANLGNSSSELRLSSRGFVAFRTGGSGLNAGTERARIDDNGHMRIGTQTHSGGYMLNVSSPNIGSTYGGISIQNLADADGGYYIGFYKSNNTLLGKIVQNSSSVSYDTTSDYRLKENVVTDWDATTRLKQLKPSRFNFKGYKDETVDGFLAHEVSSIVPEAISGEKDAVDKDGNPVYQGIDHSKLVPLLTKALQEAVTKIETLEAEVEKLKG